MVIPEGPMPLAQVTPLLSESQIKTRVDELGVEIARDYHDCRVLVLVSVLKGSFIFTADLSRAISVPLRIEFLGVRSYGEGTTTSGVVQITQDLVDPIAGTMSRSLRTSFTRA